MQKKFFTNLLLLVFLNLLIKPFWIFGIDRTVQNTVGTTTYGLYFALFNFSFLFSMLLDLGITYFNIKNIAQNQQLIRKHLSHLLVIKCILSFVYILITIMIGLVLSYDSYQMKLLCALSFNQVLISLIIYLRSNLSGLHLFKIDSFLSVLDKAIMIAICVPLLWCNILESKLSIEWFIGIQTVAYAITALIAFLIVINKASFIKLRWNYPFFLLIMKKSFPFAFLILLMTIYNKIDSVMIERMLPNGAEEAGIYAASYRLLDAVSMLGVLFASILLPIFSKQIKNNESVHPLTKLSSTLLIVPAIIICSASYFYRQPIMKSLYIESTAYWGQIFGYLMLSFIAVAFSYIFGTLLTANGNLKVLNWTAGISVLVNILLNYFLIPQYHALGATFATLVSLFGVAIIHFFFANRFFNLKISYRFIFMICICTGGVILINFFSRELTGSWIINFSCSLAGSITLAFILKLINFKGLIRFNQ